MHGQERYPFSLKSALQLELFENIFDSNMFSAYIPHDLPVPSIDDPRKNQSDSNGFERHPGYVRSSKINQLNNYIGFIKRVENESYNQYLPLLFQELNLFLRIMEEIVYTMNITIPLEIYIEQKKGFENFFINFKNRGRHNIEWIGQIWKTQQSHLTHIDMLIETLKVRGKIFDYSDDPLYETIVAYCRVLAERGNLKLQNDIDVRFIANSCVKAARDREPKTLWSGDQHVLQILKSIYAEMDISSKFPQIYLRSGYEPLNYAPLFPVSQEKAYAKKIRKQKYQ